MKFRAIENWKKAMAIIHFLIDSKYSKYMFGGVKDVIYDPKEEYLRIESEQEYEHYRYYYIMYAEDFDDWMRVNMYSKKGEKWKR